MAPAPSNPIATGEEPPSPTPSIGGGPRSRSPFPLPGSARGRAPESPSPGVGGARPIASSIGGRASLSLSFQIKGRSPDPKPPQPLRAFPSAPLRVQPRVRFLLILRRSIPRSGHPNPSPYIEPLYSSSFPAFGAYQGEEEEDYLPTYYSQKETVEELFVEELPSEEVAPTVA